MRIVATLALIALLCTGCIERRIFITSDPPGAIVHVNDVQVGRTPVEVEYTYDGVYDVRLRLPGFEPMNTSARTKLRAHDLPLVDVVAGALPVRFRSHSRWHFQLVPSDSDVDALVLRGQQFRQAQMPGSEIVPGAGELLGEPEVIDDISRLPGQDAQPDPDESQDDNSPAGIPPTDDPPSM
jgi:PEGA domain